MKRFFTLAGLLAIATIGALFVYANYFPSHTNRFRLTIEVDTPSGVKSGSSVIQTTFWESGDWGPVEARGVRAEAHGDAIFIDLGDRKNIVGLFGWGVKGSDENKLFGLTRATLAPGRRIDWKDEYKLKGKGDLPPDYVPTMATFSDLNDPKTARIVSVDEFEQAFGVGIRFRKATLETTNDAVTRGIQSKLSWLPHPAYLSGRFGCGPNEPHCLHGGNFLKD